MASVGPYLRELREQKGISLDEVARATRIAPRYLEALEADEHAALPERVFTKGFIRAYCQVLGEAPDEAFARFEGQDAVGAAVPVAPPAPVDVPKNRMRGGRGHSGRFGSGGSSLPCDTSDQPQMR